MNAGSNVRQPWRFNWRSFAAAASLALVFVAGWTVGHTGPSVRRNIVATTGSSTIESDVVDAHIRSLMGNHLVDVASTDKHTVKPWFDGKLPFAPPVQRLDGTEFPLVGGRLEYVDGRETAAVVYRHKKHLINLFLWPSSDAATAPVLSVDRGYSVVHWNEDGMAFWAVSDVSASDLQTFASLIQKAK